MSTIVVGVDGSPGARSALDFALREARLRRRSASSCVSSTSSAGRTSTVFKGLTLRGVPAGATVTATCGKGCKRASLSFRNVAGTVSLKPFFAKRAKRGTLKAGTKIRVVVSAPNMIAAVKTLTVRPRKAPTVATRCLAPGAAAETLCA